MLTCHEGVAVVVVNWNGLRFLPRCLTSLAGQTLKAEEIVVVDNGSEDGSVEYLEREWAPVVRLIRHSTNRGFTAGVNSGIRSTRAPWVAILNNDAEAGACWLEALLQVASLDPRVGMCASKILLDDPPGCIDKTGHLLYPDGLNGGRGFGEKDCGQYATVGEILFPDGCAALYRRSMLDEIGLFDERFFAYGDDAELGLRARLYGWKCLYAPDAAVLHHHSGSLGKSSPRKAFLVERNRIWLAFKLFPLRLLILNGAYSLVRYGWHAWSMVSGQGSAGRFVKEQHAPGLVWVLVKAFLSAMVGLPGILRDRRRIAMQKRISSVEFLHLIRRFRISARELALRDR